MFKSLIAEIKDYKKPSILASAFMAFEVIFEISISFVMTYLLNDGVKSSNMGNILKFGSFLSLFCGIQSAKYGAKASAGSAKNLRKALLLLTVC